MKRILVVDDMAIFREPIAASLRRAGYEVECASNGGDALQVLQCERPDLVLLDVAMPGVDGMGCLKALRGNPKTRDVPVIMLTAMAEREVLTEVARLGVQGYLLKSQFSLDGLLSRVRDALDGESGTGGPPQESAQPVSPPKRGPAEKPAPKIAPPPSLSKPDVLERIRKNSQLQAVPPVLHHVIALTNSSRSSFDEIADALRQDHALALKVMKLANSSFFGTGNQAKNLQEAAQRIGMAGIRNTIGAITTMEHFGTASVGGLTPQRFWEHSLATAALADLIGQAVGAKNAEHVFLAGLLHDIGRLVLGAVFPEHYQWVLGSGAERNVDLVVPEQEVFGLSHDEVTDEILLKWEVPGDLREAASSHELQVKRIDEAARDPRSALVVALANRLAHALLLGDSGNSMLLPIRDHAKALALKGDSVRSIAREAASKAQDTGVFYASQGEERFREPVAAELAQKTAGRVKLAVLARGAPRDPLSLFCEQLGWLDSVRPRLAVLYALGDTEMTNRVGELRKLEETLGRNLAVVAASPNGSVAPSSDALQGRPCAIVQVPGRYDAVVKTISRHHVDASAAHAAVV